MKELSIEEKAKAYDKAIERARVWKEKSGMPADRQGILDDIFPELKESEDEEIRKRLIEYFSGFYDRFATDRNHTNVRWEGLEVKKVLAWLEKQGDKDKLIKELGEYKVKYTQEVLEKHINSMNNKDDEKLRKTTISFLKDFVAQGYENAVECIDWVEKQGKQNLNDNIEPNPAWSEEDSPYYDDICEILINLLHSETADVNKDAVQKDLDWLISLRPQNTWKPSIAQLNALSIVSKGNVPDDIEAIVSLYQYLNKLREE